MSRGGFVYYSLCVRMFVLHRRGRTDWGDHLGSDVCVTLLPCLDSSVWQEYKETSLWVRWFLCVVGLAGWHSDCLEISGSCNREMEPESQYKTWILSWIGEQRGWERVQVRLGWAVKTTFREKDLEYFGPPRLSAHVSSSGLQTRPAGIYPGDLGQLFRAWF